MNVDEKVGRNIRKYRMAYNMTLKELAVRLHKSVSTVSKYEKGDISLDISTFLELSKIFKVSPLAIIGDEIAEEEEECTYMETIEKLYMYSYDGIGKVIVKSLIEQQAVEGSDFCHRLVYHGREVCTARTKPHCDRCCLADICKKVGVEK